MTVTIAAVPTSINFLNKFSLWRAKYRHSSRPDVRDVRKEILVLLLVYNYIAEHGVLAFNVQWSVFDCYMSGCINYVLYLFTMVFYSTDSGNFSGNSAFPNSLHLYFITSLIK